MATAVPTKGYTFADFCALIREDQKASLIDGVIYMDSPDNTDANKLLVWLGTLISLFVQIRILGEVFVSRVAFRLDDRNGPEPDLAFVRKNRLHLVKRGYVNGPPDLGVEIVSPDSVQRDYKDKRGQYERAKMPEYLIIDELERKVLLLRLSPQGKYREVKPRNGELHSEVLRGFWIRPEWLWQDPLPQTMDVLNRILSRLG
jgi:Uma2 family endonuclease